MRRELRGESIRQPREGMANSPGLLGSQNLVRAAALQDLAVCNLLSCLTHKMVVLSCGHGACFLRLRGSRVIEIRPRGCHYRLRRLGVGRAPGPIWAASENSSVDWNPNPMRTHSRTVE